jgi:hypothetical protein
MIIDIDAVKMGAIYPDYITQYRPGRGSSQRPFYKEID